MHNTLLSPDTTTALVSDHALRIRPADERGMADHGWLKSAHSFSFAGYHDPEHMQFGSLRVINDDWVAAGKGFGAHPHRDAEIFSYVVDGALEHRDSLGNGSVVAAGGVQYMSAGGGVTHSEFNPSNADPVRFLQIWLLPNVSGGTPRYDTLQLDPTSKDGALALFLSPDGRDGSMRVNADADVYAATLTGDQTISFSVRPQRNAWVQVVSGSLSVNDKQLARGDGLAVSAAGTLHFDAGDNAEFILFDLEAT